MKKYAEGRPIRSVADFERSNKEERMRSNHYGITSKWDEGFGVKITFETGNKELYDMVLSFVDVCVDACRYRNTLERIMATINVGADGEVEE